MPAIHDAVASRKALRPRDPHGKPALALALVFAGVAALAAVGGSFQGTALAQERYPCPSSIGGLAGGGGTISVRGDLGGVDCLYQSGDRHVRFGAQWATPQAPDLSPFGCAAFRRVQADFTDAAGGIYLKSESFQAQATSLGSDRTLAAAGRPHAEAVLKFAEGRAKRCPEPAVAPAPIAPPPAPQPPQAELPPEVELSPEMVSGLLSELEAQLRADPQRLVSMVQAGQLSVADVRRLEAQWRERAETLALLASAWSRLLADRELVAVAVATTELPSGLYGTGGVARARFLLPPNLFGEEERFWDPLFRPLDDREPGSLMALIPASELSARTTEFNPLERGLEGPGLTGRLHEAQMELALEGAAVYRSHAEAERFAVEVELDELRQVLRVLEGLEESGRLR